MNVKFKMLSMIPASTSGKARRRDAPAAWFEVSGPEKAGMIVAAGGGIVDKGGGAKVAGTMKGVVGAGVVMLAVAIAAAS